MNLVAWEKCFLADPSHNMEFILLNMAGTVLLQDTEKQLGILCGTGVAQV